MMIHYSYLESKLLIFSFNCMAICLFYSCSCKPLPDKLSLYEGIIQGPFMSFHIFNDAYLALSCCTQTICDHLDHCVWAACFVDTAIKWPPSKPPIAHRHRRGTGQSAGLLWYTILPESGHQKNMRSLMPSLNRDTQKLP